MRIFLTGESGILGSDIKNQFLLAGDEIKGYNSTNIEIGNLRDVQSKVNDFQPDVIIHCAAMTNVDLCEDDKNGAILTNVIGSQNMAQAARLAGAKIVYISSCGIYGDTKSLPYNELDNLNPLTYHHFTKLEGEKRTKEQHNDFLIIRPGWLFGGTQQHKKNFVEARRKEAMLGTVLKSAVDKSGSPTYTLHLTKQIIHLINNGCVGTFNAVNEGFASRFEYVSEIVKLFKLPVEIEPVNSNEFPRRAAMPDNECLENLNLNLINKNIMPNWKLALKEYITANYDI